MYFGHDISLARFLNSPVKKCCSRTASKLLPYSCTLSILLHTYRESVSNPCFISAHAIFVSRVTICRVTVVRKVGLEPTRILLLKILSLVCLPISPLSHNYLFLPNHISAAFSGNLSLSAAVTFANELSEEDLNASLISLIFLGSVTITGLSSII